MSQTAETVDWACKNCGDFNVRPRNEPPTEACGYCGEHAGWVLAANEW